MQLVNGAYRPTPQLAGWTHEADLVAGERVTVVQVMEALGRDSTTVLVGLKGAEIIACIQVDHDGSRSHLGMFAVAPALQNAGIGKQMLAYGEGYARTTFAAKTFVMLVILERRELVTFYLRRGYQQTGDVLDYPLLANAGIPKRNGLQVIRLEKEAVND